LANQPAMRPTIIQDKRPIAYSPFISERVQ
jgi:hypothetical protein